MTRQGSLAALFDPRSLAVVGASDDPTKWGHLLARHALEASRERLVALVNRRGGLVLGRPAHDSVSSARAALGEDLELVVVCVPAAALVESVRDAVAAGARAIVAITAGLGELGAEGAAVEVEAVAVARAGGAVLVGPNCLGVADTTTGLQLAHAVLPPGGVTVLSQSGNVVLDLAELLVERGLGIARFVSVGNQADLNVVEVMRACVHHDGTRAVAIYAEDVVDGRGFVESARALALAGKPVVLLAPGRSAAAVRSAVSHTGSMTSPARVVDAACVEAGVRRVENPTQMADQLEGLLGARRLHGRRVAVLTDGGGHGAMAADALVVADLETRELAEGTRSALRSALWAGSGVANPVDLAGAGDRDPMSYARAVSVLLAADEVDGVLMTGYFGGYSAQAGLVADLELAAAAAIAEAVTAQRKPVVTHTIFPASPTSLVLRAAGIPVHRDVDRACAVLAGLVSIPVAESAPVEQDPGFLTGERHDRLARPVLDDSYATARSLFAEAGVSFPAGRIVHEREELDSAFAATGFPLVLKALGSVHKSDSGGVVLGLADAASAQASYDDLVRRLDPPAVSVEAMADLSAGVEVIAGCVRDPTYGPVLMVGLGGIHAEVLADIACALAPASPERVEVMLRSLRGAPILLGARGRAPIDLEALAASISSISRVAAAHPEIAELEVNPLLADPRGAVALDARVVLGGQAG